MDLHDPSALNHKLNEKGSKDDCIAFKRKRD